jgi:hypothetical protein
MLTYQRPRESSLKLPEPSSYFDRPYESHKPIWSPLKCNCPFLYLMPSPLNGTQPGEYFGDLRLLTRQFSFWRLNCLSRVANSLHVYWTVRESTWTPSHLLKPAVSF